MKKRDRYVTFDNIDCFEHACLVVETMQRILKESGKDQEPFWQKLNDKVPGSFKTRAPDEDLLYFVCSQIFYLDELFLAYGGEEDNRILHDAEFDCC